jgi:hypothetical protein
VYFMQALSLLRWRLAIIGLLVVTLLAVVATLGLASPDEAGAIAACSPHSPSAEEQGFLSALQTWRNGAIPGSLPLNQSASLNAAAQGYAQFLANNPGASGHYADGSNWVARGINCGYPADMAAGGEGVAMASTGLDALSAMTAEPGSGIHVPSDSGYPIKCVGIGKATAGAKTVWVTLLFGTFGGSCPQAVTGGGTSPTTASSATSASASPTTTATTKATPTATATATPTRAIRFLPMVTVD